MFFFPIFAKMVLLDWTKITHEFYMNNNVNHMLEIVIARKSTSKKLSRNIFFVPLQNKKTTRNSLSLVFVLSKKINNYTFVFTVKRQTHEKIFFWKSFIFRSVY